jgi:sulfonate transport system substrate-binding protein
MKATEIAFALVLALVAGPLAAARADQVVHVGYQKYGKLVLLKNKGTLEAALAPLGARVEWVEFPSGPPLLEAMNAGAIEFGNAGEAPPIFAQAARVPFVYIAYEPPAPRGEAILVPRDSAVRTVADLRGKKIALNKGSNVHYLLIKALERAGVAYADLQPVFLAPADARAAFARGAVDAWVIWDPFLAAAEAATGARVLADGTGLVANTQFYLGARAFVQANPRVLEILLTQLREVDRWARTDIGAVAAQLSPAIGLAPPVVEAALRRQSYGIQPIDAVAIAQQQNIADAFYKLGLVPRSIKVSDAVRPVP